MSREESNVIKFVRFPLACMVVLIHTNVCVDGWQYTSSMWFSPSLSDIFHLINLAFCKVLSGISVPMFFFISGFLFFQGLKSWNTKVWIQKLQHRIYTLLIPYLVWISFFIIVAIFRLLYSGDSIKDWYLQHNGLLGLYCTDVALVPMWYIRDLIFVIVISPFLFFFLKQRKGCFCRLSYLYLVILFFCKFFFPIEKLEAILYVSLGACFALKEHDFVKFCCTYRWVGCIMFIIFFVFEIFYGGETTSIGKCLEPFFIVVGIITITNVAFYLTTIKKEKPRQKMYNLAKFSFFLYAFHVFILSDIISMINNVMLGVDSQNLPIEIVENHFVLCLTALMIAVVVTIVITWLLYKVLLKISPDILKICLGIR